MKIARVVTVDGHVRTVSLDHDGRAHEIDGDLFATYRVSTREVAVASFLAPIEPRQIFGIGLNYAKHADETGMPRPQRPIVFFKGLGSVVGPDAEIALPSHARSEKVDYECELAFVIGRDCRNVSTEDALSVILGYTAANDISARDWQLEWGGGQWGFGKSFDTFCPLGPVLVTADEIPNPNSLKIRTTLNGQVVQDANTDDMIFGVADLVSFLSRDTTLVAGTVVLTGTPMGVGMAAVPQRWLAAGDEIEVWLEGVGSLRNRVVAAH